MESQQVSSISIIDEIVEKILSRVDTLDDSGINSLVDYWIPRYYKYSDDVMAVQLMYKVLENGGEFAKSLSPDKIDLWYKLTARLAQARMSLLRETKDPIIKMYPTTIIMLDYYKKKRQINKQIATTFIKGRFKVSKTKNAPGELVMTCIDSGKEYKLLLEFNVARNMQDGDILVGMLSKRLFYVYWELAEIDYYYGKSAIDILKSK